MKSRQCISSCLVVASLALSWLVLPRTAIAQSAEELTLSAVLMDGPYFQADRWMPVRVLVINRSNSPIEGQVVFPFKGQSEQVTFRLPVSVPPHASMTQAAYVFVPTPPEPPGSSKKNTEVPPICTAELRNAGGAMIARCPILSKPIDDDPDGGNLNRIRLDRPFIVSLNPSKEPEVPQPDSVVDPSSFISLFQSTTGSRLLNVPMAVTDAPRDPLGYDMAGIVLLDGAEAGRLDPGQQQALLDYMTAGGIVVLADPLGESDPASTWLAPYLPVRRIGGHYADSLSIQTGQRTTQHKFIAPLDLCELVADPAIAGATIVAAEPNYVHAAYERVGLGRLIVTSFPVSAFDPKDDGIRQVWAQLFPAKPSLRWEDSQLADSQSQLLESMVGLKVPPWIVAASVVAGYVLIVLIIQLVARQGWRPTGFAAAIAASILIAVGLLIFSLFRDRTVDLSMARIDVINLQRGGVRNEAATLLGPDQQDFPLHVVPGATLRQAVSAEARPLDLMISPLKADRAAIYPRRIERVWQSASAVPPEMSLIAKGQFDEKGVSLSIDNHVGVLTGPVVIGTNGQFDLSTLAAGANTARADDGVLNRPAVQLDAEQLRRKILDAASTPAGQQRGSNEATLDDTITLAGWLADAPLPLLQLPAGQTPKISKSNVLVRTPVQIDPTPIGQKVHISKAFTQMINGELGAMPYDQNKREWLDAFMSQEFLVGFAFPSGIGHVKTTHVQIDLTASAAQQTVTIRRGQIVHGQPTMNPTGPEVGNWSQMIGTNTVGFDVSPGDVDANGWVWLMVSVDGPPGGQAHWQFKELSVSYDGEIDGPPQAAEMPKREVFTTPAVSSRPNPPKKPTPPSTKPAKKPATKPTTKPAPKKKEASPN